jgi:hypothetical protein
MSETPNENDNGSSQRRMREQAEAYATVSKESEYRSLGERRSGALPIGGEMSETPKENV